MVVIKISGKPIDEPGVCAGLWGAIASAGLETRLVIVHGGGRRVDARLAALGLESPRIDGLRVTPDSHMGVVAGTLAGEVNRTLVGLLRSAGVDAVGIGLGDGGLIEAELIDDSLGRVGRVIGGDGRVIEALHSRGLVPVVSSIGFDEQGGLLNVNADDAAAGVAEVIGADRLVLLTDVPGVLDSSGAVIETLDSESAAELIASGVIDGGMAVKARAAVHTAAAIGSDVLVGGWADAAALIAGESVGTHVVAGALRRRPQPVAG